MIFILIIHSTIIVITINIVILLLLLTSLLLYYKVAILVRAVRPARIVLLISIGNTPEVSSQQILAGVNLSRASGPLDLRAIFRPLSRPRGSVRPII